MQAQFTFVAFDPWIYRKVNHIVSGQHFAVIINFSTPTIKSTLSLNIFSGHFSTMFVAFRFNPNRDQCWNNLESSLQSQTIWTFQFVHQGGADSLVKTWNREPKRSLHQPSPPLIEFRAVGRAAVSRDKYTRFLPQNFKYRTKIATESPPFSFPS